MSRNRRAAARVRPVERATSLQGELAVLGIEGADHRESPLQGLDVIRALGRLVGHLIENGLGTGPSVRYANTTEPCAHPVWRSNGLGGRAASTISPMTETTPVRRSDGRRRLASSRRPAGAPTVRDAAFDVMRRHGLTTIFGNPGIDRDPVPDRSSAGHPVRARLCTRASVVGMATGYALARGRARVREPAHRRRPGQRDQCDRQRARLPRAARDRRRPAGSPADRVRAVPDRASPRAAGRRVSGVAGLPVRAQDVPGAIARAYHEAKAGARPGAAWWCRWATGSSRPTSSRPARRRGSCARTRSTPAGRRARRSARRGASRPRSSSAAPGRQPRWVGCGGRARRAAALSGLAGAVQPRASASRRITRCSPATCRGSGG